MKTKFVVSVPFTGLGNYGGFRGNRWLRNRIKIFEQFVIPSLLNQSDRNFIVWLSWRREEKDNKYVKELLKRLEAIPNFKVVFTYSGVPFWDDKYEDNEAKERLFNTLHQAMPTLMDAIGECDEVHWLLQPSDDLYDIMTVESVKKAFENKDIQAVSYTKGYITNYNTLEVLEYNPTTNPPFFAIKFPKKIFFDPGKHINYTGPYKSHEYIGDKLKLAYFDGRGFMVGTHGENISTHFNHPFGGRKIEGIEKDLLLSRFAVGEPLKLPISIRKKILRRLPYKAQRKLRYLFGEKVFSRVYNFLRN